VKGVAVAVGTVDVAVGGMVVGVFVRVVVGVLVWVAVGAAGVFVDVFVGVFVGVLVAGGIVGVFVGMVVGVGVPPPEALKAANASTRPYPKLLFGIWLLGIPPHVCTGLRMTLGLAVCSSSCLVAVISRTREGRADQISATTPTTCGPAMDVPDRLA
jgi:hypothetical protein